MNLSVAGLVALLILAALALFLTWDTPRATYEGGETDCIGEYSWQCRGEKLELNFSTKKEIKPYGYQMMVDGSHVSGDLKLISIDIGDVDILSYSLISHSLFNDGNHDLTLMTGECKRPLNVQFSC